jgi:hypothetical protein
MDALAKEVERLASELDQYLLPGTLMDCFEIHRRGQMRKASAHFNDNELSWFLHMLNELRGAADRKDDFDLMFDPIMYMVHHLAWTAPPGLKIELPPLNTEVLKQAEPDSRFREIAESEVAVLRTLADTYPDDAIIGLACIAAAAYLDKDAAISDRQSSIRYLAINASAKLEDYWAADDSLWLKTGNRIVMLDDVVAEMKEKLLRERIVNGEEVRNDDLVCYNEDEIKLFAFNADKFLLSGKTRHLALCGVCQQAIALWIEKARDAEERMLAAGGEILRLN